MKSLRYIIFGFILLSFFSCEKEEETIVQQNSQSFQKNSTIAGLLSRTTQNPTSKDNVIDNSSLISVQLPEKVRVDGIYINVVTPADYQLVQDAKDAYSNDDDKVYFVEYPITIKFQNYTTRVVQNEEELHDAIESCGQDDGFDEIDCISLVYPININVYDSNNQIANTIAIASNSSLFNFLANLNSTTYVAIKFPIAALNSGGQTVQLNSNAELTAFMENAIAECDDDTGGGANNETALRQLLSSGTWNISYCYYDNENETSYYAGYNFTFNSNESVVAQKGASSTTGQWDVHNDDGYLRLDIHSFEGSVMDDIETNWRVIDNNQTTILLKKENSDSTDRLTFTKN